MKTLLFALMCLTGCARLSHVQVPANTVTFKTEHGGLTLVHPQDTSMHGVKVDIATNGTIHAEIESLTTRNSPDVIDRTAAGQVAIIKQWGETGSQMFEAGAKAAGATAGTAAKTAK